MAITSHNHPLPGRDGETLAMDVALDGSADAERLLIVSSACHGVEGYCGSGVQVFAAHDAEWREHARSAGVAVLYIHALNPHGFSWVRRVTNENVDLNRNFQDFSRPLPQNPAYAELHDLLLPAQWPPTAENEAAIQDYIAKHGLTRFQAASTPLPMACSLAAPPPPGATRRCARCCAGTANGPGASHGSICTPASGLRAWASASLRAPTMRPH